MSATAGCSIRLRPQLTWLPVTWRRRRRRPRPRRRRRRRRPHCGSSAATSAWQVYTTWWPIFDPIFMVFLQCKCWSDSPTFLCRIYVSRGTRNYSCAKLSNPIVDRQVHGAAVCLCSTVFLEEGLTLRFSLFDLFACWHLAYNQILQDKQHTVWL